MLLFNNESMEVENNMNAINLYETEFPGMYVTEDGYYVDDDGNVYNEDGTIIQEGIISKIGGLFKRKAAPAVSKVATGAPNYNQMAMNNLNKLKSLAAKKAETVRKVNALGMDDYVKQQLAKNAQMIKMARMAESFDLYETDMPGIYITEDGYYVDSDGSIYDEDGDLIEEDAVVINELFGSNNLNSYQQAHNDKINSMQRRNAIKGLVKQQVGAGVGGMAGGAVGGIAGKAIGSMNRFKGAGLGAKGAIAGAVIGGAYGALKPTYNAMKTHMSLQRRKY